MRHFTSTLEIHGIPFIRVWKSMDLHELIKPEIPWISSSPSLEFHGISQIMKGWSSMDFQLALSGIPWNFTNHQKLEFHGIPAVWAWISMEFHKSPEDGIP